LNVSIVIPVYNALSLTKQCVKSVYEHGAAASFEIVVVDNGSAPDVGEWARAEAMVHENFRYLRYDEPLGFARSVNAGAGAAAGEMLIVLNSDTLVTPGWIDELHRVLVADPSLGAVTPITNHAGEPAQMDFGTVDLSASKALAVVARRAAKRGPERVPRVLYLPQRLTFFCVALRMEVWRQFGGLDESYQVGNFEDDDLCLRLRVAGYRLGVALDVFVYHHNNATFHANKISHGGWMMQNAVRFAERARTFSEAEEVVASRWPKRSGREMGREISVVVLPRKEGSLERTLRSLRNQTIAEFEVLLPGSGESPKGSWIAYVTEGDLLYPFHLEALLEAMERTGVEAIFADGWVRGGDRHVPHPDVAKQIRDAPLLLSGWMHHVSLHADRLFEESIPVHWPRLTWEMAQAPQLAAYPPAADAEPRPGLVDVARGVYRRLVPLEARLRLDRRVRRMIGRPLPDPEQVQLRRLAEHLEALTAQCVDAGRFATEGGLPAVVMFNAISWSALTQRQQHFARGLGALGHTVFWIEPALTPPRQWWSSRPLQQLAPGVHRVRLPALARDIYHMEWSDGILEAVLAALTAALRQTAAAYGVTAAVSLVNYPRWQPLAEALHKRLGWKVASDLLDDQKAMAGMYQTALFTFEDRLVACSDLVVTSSVVLQERLLPVKSVLLQNAVDYELFSTAMSSGQMDGLPRPIVGFFGALANWLDVELIRAAALRYPGWSFVFIGPQTFSHSSVEVEWLRSTHLPNITVLPQMDQRTLAGYLADFDVCTMPFLDVPVTRSMNPVKLYEYLAAGKPAVCRDLPEVRHLAEGEAAGLVALYRTPEEFFAALEAALAEDSEALRERRRAFARVNDWEQRVEVLSRLLVDMVAG
jgi:GT2 family glycosyltransferase/glycosyltransferase involved in cell wall biosynthesis